ncbi:MAG: hypothetical protein ACJ8IQ_03610 [Chthoniobacterales bacterium]
MQNKLNRGFSQIREDELDQKAQVIIASLTGNAAFPTPTPTLANVQAKLDAVRQHTRDHDRRANARERLLLSRPWYRPHWAGRVERPGNEPDQLEQ